MRRLDSRGEAVSANAADGFSVNPTPVEATGGKPPAAFPESQRDSLSF
jgi:hypothetical protein